MPQPSQPSNPPTDAAYFADADGPNARLLRKADGTVLGVRQTDGNFRPIDPETALIIKTVVGEDRSGKAPGMAAVGAVVMNRARVSGQSLKEVIQEPGAFEAWARPDARKLMNGLTPDNHLFQLGADAVLPVLMGEAPDPTKGATNYYSPGAQAALGRPKPNWDDGHGVMIADQLFFNGPYGQERARRPRPATITWPTDPASAGPPKLGEIFPAQPSPPAHYPSWQEALKDPAYVQYLVQNQARQSPNRGR